MVFNFTIVGRITMDITPKTSGDKEWCSVPLVVNHTKERFSYVSIFLSTKLIPYAKDYLKKGQLIYAFGYVMKNDKGYVFNATDIKILSSKTEQPKIAEETKETIKDTLDNISEKINIEDDLPF